MTQPTRTRHGEKTGKAQALFLAAHLPDGVAV